MREIIIMKKRISLLIILCSLFFIKSVYATETKEVSFVKCIDGDTAVLKLDGEDETVRFIAIDTLEMDDENADYASLAMTASNYTCNKLTNAKEIVLEFEDNVQVDKYNRILAWVWVDKSLLQKDLVLNGYAKVAYIYDKYTYVESLCVSQNKIKSYKTGIWALSGIDGGYCNTIDLLGKDDIIEYSNIRKEALTDTEKKIANVLNSVEEKTTNITDNDNLIKTVLYIVIFGSAIVYILVKRFNK